MNILILLTNNDEGHANDYPPCLVDVDGTPLIEHVIKQVQTVRTARHIYAMYQHHVKRHHLNEVVRLLVPEAKIYEINIEPEGDACTALLSWGYLDKDQPLLVMSGNALIKDDINRILADFRVRDLDGGVVVFRSIHPRYAYVRLDENQQIIETADRRPISQNACAEFFYFRKAELFLDAAQDLIRKDVRSEGRFPISLVFNQMLLRQMRIGVYPIQKEQYVPRSSGFGHVGMERGAA
jgi:dTDP-glucose pyrophosphorylase